jgi:type I restriction enzyme S subunit
MTGKSWSRIRIADLVAAGEAEVKTGPFGTQLHASDYVESGTPVINVRNIGFGGIRPDKLEYIDDATVKRLSSHLLQPDDIVFGRKGAVERHVLIQHGQRNWFQGSDCMRLRLSAKSLLPRFLSYHLLTQGHQQWMAQQCSHGATMASLNQGIVGRIEFLAPSPATQHAIASILSAYDDLIENNTRRIAILEEMARRLYEEWFVRFRFPDHEGVPMVESELGLVPQGWQRCSLDSFGEVITGKTPSKANPDFYGDDVPFVKTPDMHGNAFVLVSGESLSLAGAKSQSKKTLPSGSLCVSCIGTIGVVSITTEPCQTNQQINSIVLSDVIAREFLFLRLKDAKKTLENLGANGATMGNVNKGNFAAMEITAPPLNLLARFHEAAEPMFDLMRSLARKNQNLRTTRDLLLPKLISGELDVSMLPEPQAETA